MIYRVQVVGKHAEYHLRHVAVPRLGISTDLHPALPPVVIPLALGASEVLARPPQPETSGIEKKKKKGSYGICALRKVDISTK